MTVASNGIHYLTATRDATMRVANIGEAASTKPSDEAKFLSIEFEMERYESSRLLTRLPTSRIFDSRDLRASTLNVIDPIK